MEAISSYEAQANVYKSTRLSKPNYRTFILLL
jgi:hypothetical protein